MSEVIQDVATVVIAVAAIYIAYIGYSLRERQHHAQTIRFIFEGWGEFNDVILKSEEYREFETKMHPHGDVSANEIRKMYYYFGILNKARTTLFLVWMDDIDIALGNADINLIANLLYRDREFIRTHVFPRGYVHLPSEIEKRWALSDARNGEPIGMNEVLTMPKRRSLFVRLFFRSAPTPSQH